MYGSSALPDTLSEFCILDGMPAPERAKARTLWPARSAALERWTSCQTILRSIPSCAPSNGKTNMSPIENHQAIGFQPSQRSQSASGSKPSKIRPPSSGSRGSRFKIASSTLMISAFLRFSATQGRAVSGR